MTYGRKRWLHPTAPAGSVAHDPTAPSFQVTPLRPVSTGPVPAPRVSPITAMRPPQHRSGTTQMLPAFMPAPK